MEMSEMILLGVAALIAIFIIVKIAKTIFRILIGLAVIAALWLVFKGGIGDFSSSDVDNFFKNTTITQLMNTHCTPESKEGLKCKCIITPVYNDLSLRFTSQELTELESNKKRMADEMFKSLKNKRTTIEDCLGEKKDSSLKYLKKVKDIMEIINE